jgi:hypothetical protein
VTNVIPAAYEEVWPSLEGDMPAECDAEDKHLGVKNEEL